MPRRFFVFDVIGTGLWASTFTVLGYVSWQNFDRAVTIASHVTLVLGTLFVLGLAVIVVRARHNVGQT